MKLTSIVIPTHNEVSLLRECIASIKWNTLSRPYEIIVVDNGSADETLDYLLGEAVTFVSLPANLGFPAACNYGLRIARGDVLLLLNNDVLVGENWLDNMLDCLFREETTGIVGPVTNYAGGRQQIKEPFTSLAELAEKHNREHKGEALEVKRLIGFCFMFRRELLEQVGFLDERFSPGHYEDDDFCHRAGLAGFRLKIALDTFVFHHGSASFGKLKDEQARLVVRNRAVFMDKWGFDPAVPDQGMG